MENIQIAIKNFLQENTTDIMLIVALFIFGKGLLSFAVKKVIKCADDGNDKHDTESEKKAKTLGHIILSIGNIAIYIVIFLMVLGLFDVDIRPILAGLGIGGLALGFGAQSLVKDIVTGIFILLESQYNIGDKVKIGSDEGTVIKISMRSTVLRDDEGRTHYISNGSIKNAINFSKQK